MNSLDELVKKYVQQQPCMSNIHKLHPTYPYMWCLEKLPIGYRSTLITLCMYAQQDYAFGRVGLYIM